MAKIVDWYALGSRLLAQLADVRPRQQATVLDAFSRESGIAVSYARRILAATRAVDEIAATNDELAAALRKANAQAVATIWRWLAYDKTGATAAALALIRTGTTVRALEDDEKMTRLLVKRGVAGSARRRTYEEKPARRRMIVAETVLGEANRILGARLDWVRPGLLPRYQNLQKLPFRLAWLSSVRFGHFIFEGNDGAHTVCHIVWPRHLATRDNIRGVVLTACGLACFNTNILIVIEDEAEATEAIAMLNQRTSCITSSVEVMRVRAH